MTQGFKHINSSKRKVLTVILIAAALLFAGDRLGGMLLKHANAHRVHGEAGRVNFIADSVRADVLVFGSSRALHHYVPRVITDSTGLTCYNCGLEGQGIITNYALLRAVTRRYQPRVIIYEVAYHYDAEAGGQGRGLNVVRSLGMLPQRDSILIDIDLWERLRLLSKIYPYNSTLGPLLADKIVADEYDCHTKVDGYMPLHGHFDPSKARHLWGTADEKPELDEVKLRYLEALMKEYGSRLIVISSPFYAIDDRLLEHHKAITELCTRYQVPCTIISGDSSFSGKPELWDDDRHLNDTGAQMFTRRYVVPAIKARL